jgi:hypothetical protein
VFGLATCFIKDDGNVSQVTIFEPIPSAALEAILKAVPTSYLWAEAIAIGEVWDGEKPKLPANVPDDAQICENFLERLIAAARTYQVRPEATKHIALGDRRDNFNYSIDRKRVLNVQKVVRAEDNVKQHPHTHQVL